MDQTLKRRQKRQRKTKDSNESKRGKKKHAAHKQKQAWATIQPYLAALMLMVLFLVPRALVTPMTPAEEERRIQRFNPDWWDNELAYAIPEFVADARARLDLDALHVDAMRGRQGTAMLLNLAMQRG